jgi:hypothetical protein
MKTLEKTFGILLVIAIGFKLESWPFGDTFSFFSLLPLAIIYYIFSFAFFNNIKLRNIFRSRAYSGISGWRIAGAVGTGIGLSETCIGMLYKIMHWPGADAYLNIGLIHVFIVAIVTLVKYLSSKSNYYTAILARIIIIGGLGLFVNFFPFNSHINLNTKEERYKGIIDNIQRNPEHGEYFFVVVSENGADVSDFRFWPSSWEYANEGDSIIKLAGSLMLIIKKPNGDSKEFFYRE